MDTITWIFASVLAFLVAITVHEGAHAWMSNRLGDPTAKLMGRLTINPLAHMDLYGTVLIPLFLIFIRSPLVFGWAKPVQFDPYNLKNPRKDSALISLAGPVSNLLLAIFLALFFNVFKMDIGPGLNFVSLLFFLTVRLNIILAVFNFIPVHPLDGGKIFVGLLSENDAYEADRFLHQYGTVILIMLIFPIFGGVSPLSFIMTPIVSFLLNLLLPSIGSI